VFTSNASNVGIASSQYAYDTLSRRVIAWTGATTAPHARRTSADGRFQLTSSLDFDYVEHLPQYPSQPLLAVADAQTNQVFWVGLSPPGERPRLGVDLNAAALTRDGQTVFYRADGSIYAYRLGQFGTPPVITVQPFERFEYGTRCDFLQCRAFEFGAAGTEPLRYTWQSPGDAFVTQVGREYRPNFGGGRDYYARVSNLFGYADSRPIAVPFLVGLPPNSGVVPRSTDTTPRTQLRALGVSRADMPGPSGSPLAGLRALPRPQSPNSRAHTRLERAQGIDARNARIRLHTGFAIRSGRLAIEGQLGLVGMDHRG
jgi:hypothetical protein